MTDKNHRRSNKLPVNRRYEFYHNGYGKHDFIRVDGTTLSYIDENGKRITVQRVGRTDYLDKSMHGWGRTSEFADKIIGAEIGNDFCNGHRGMARAVKGAKKYVNSRFRFHEKAATKKLTLHDR